MFGAVMRLLSYLFLFAISFFFTGLGAVTMLSGHHNLKLGMLPWQGETLTWWTLGLGIFGLLSVLLAVFGKLRILLVLFSLTVLVLMVRGYFLTSYSFAGPDEARGAALLTFWAVGAVFGSLYQFKKKGARR
ncbi:MAG TPA: hypothetical protein DEH78_08210 [Solibacterales bacterium]|nr:hypothetical protein [Bryobacterales bacterium]